MYLNYRQSLPIEKVNGKITTVPFWNVSEKIRNKKCVFVRALPKTLRNVTKRTVSWSCSSKELWS